MSLVSQAYKRLCKLYRGILQHMRVLQWLMEHGRPLSQPVEPDKVRRGIRLSRKALREDPVPRFVNMEPHEPKVFLSTSPVWVSNTWVDKTLGGVTTSNPGPGNTVTVPAGDIPAPGNPGNLTYGTNAFNNIPSAVAGTGVSTNGTVYVLTGSYTTQTIIPITRNITIDGQDGSTSISGPNGVFQINANGATIENLTITGATTGAGIVVSSGVTGFSISGNTFTGNEVGVTTYGGGTFSGNEFKDQSQGVLILTDSNGDATNVNLSGVNDFNTVTDGIVVQGVAAKVTASDNTFESNTAGIQVVSGVTGFNFSGNTFTGGVVDIDTYGSGTISNGNEFAGESQGVVVVGANVSVSGNDFNTSTDGIVVQGSTANVTTTGNSFESNTVGVLVSGGTFASSDDSIGWVAGDGNVTGIQVNGGSATLSSEIISDNATGVLANGGSVTISGSVVSANTTTGIEVAGGTLGLSGIDFADSTGSNTTDLRIDQSAGSSAVTIGDGNMFAGSTYYIQNLSSESFDLSGDNSTKFSGFNAAKTPVAAGNLGTFYGIEDKIGDYLDNASDGYVRIAPGYNFVAHSSETNPGAIQRTVNVANTGDTVEIQAGTYAGNITLNQGITLSGAGDGSGTTGSTVISQASGTAVDVTAGTGSVTVENLKIADASGANGVLVNTGSNATAVNVTQDTITGAGTGVEVQTGKASVTQDFVTGNGTGVLVDSGAGTVTVNSDSITGNTTAGVENNSAATVNATGNWWGSANGPTTPLNTYAHDGMTTGDTVINNATITPWLDSGTDAQQSMSGFQPGTLDTTTPVVSAPVSQNQVIEGASATINLGSFSDAGTGENSWTVTVNWGDGSTVTSFNVNSPGPIAQSHTYAEEGNYAPTVTVIDQGGLSGSTTFNLAVADAPLTATGVPVSASEGAAVSGVKVAHFTDADPNGQASDYTATINWGDNDTTLSYNIVAATGGGFDVTASKANPYAEAGNYPISVTITETDLDAHNLSGVTPVTPSTVTTSTTATVADGLLTAVSLTAPVATEGALWSGTVFHFTDAAGSYAKIADYTALVTLGDGTTVTLTSATGNPNGQIVADGTGYDVNLSYTYAESIKASANATFSVKVTDAGGAPSISMSTTAPFTVADAALTAVSLTAPTATEGAPGPERCSISPTRPGPTPRLPTTRQWSPWVTVTP